jgi:hypothetical protein
MVPGSNVALFPHPIRTQLTDAADRYKWLLGSFVIEMNDVDYLVADLVGAITGVTSAKKAWGQSGEQLQELAREAAGQHPPAAPAVDAYAALYADRNHLVHGMWNGTTQDGQVISHHVLKLDRATKRAIAGHTDRQFTEEEIWELTVRAAELQTAIVILLGSLRGKGPTPAPVPEMS